MKKGEIWIIKFPFKGGKEQEGIRPAVILADTKTDLIIAIPLTSNSNALRFPYTIEIKKSEINNLEKDSILLIFQLQALDKERFISKIGELEKEYIEKIENVIKELFRF